MDLQAPLVDLGQAQSRKGSNDGLVDPSLGRLLGQAQSRKRPNDGLVDPSLGRLQKAIKTITIARILANKAQLTSNKNKRQPSGHSPPRVAVEIHREAVGNVNVDAEERKRPGRPIDQQQQLTTPVVPTTTSSKNDTRNPHQATGNKANAITPEKQSLPVLSLAKDFVSSKPPNHTNGAASSPSAKGGCTESHEQVNDAPSDEEAQPSKHESVTNAAPTHAATPSLPKPTHPKTLTPLTSMVPRQCGLISDNEGLSTGSFTGSHFDRALRFVQLFVPFLYLLTSARAFQRSARANAILYPTTPTTMLQSGNTLTLREILTDHDTGFHLAMAPAFFGFYGYFGALAAWYDIEPSLPIQSLAGASAGAMVAVLLGAGIAPQVAADFCADMTLSRFADFPGFGAIFRGNRWEGLMDEFLSAATNRTGTWKLQEAIVPVAVTAFDLQSLQGNVLTYGSMARAARASATFPLLFQPVGWVDDSSSNDYIFIDGGIADPNGLVGLTKTLPFSTCRRVVNLSIGTFVAARTPFDTDSIELISISITGLPQPSPFAMSKGPKAFAAAREAMQKALDTPLLRRGNSFELTIAYTTR